MSDWIVSNVSRLRYTFVNSVIVSICPATLSRKDYYRVAYRPLIRITFGFTDSRETFVSLPPADI